VKFLGYFTFLKKAVKMLCLSWFDVHPVLSTNNFQLGYFEFLLF